MFPEELTTIFKKMFEYVDVPYSDEYVQQENWYWTKTWTTAEQDEFEEWLVKYLRKPHVSAVLYRSYSNARLAKSRAAFFVMNHGWKIEEKK